MISDWILFQVSHNKKAIFEEMMIKSDFIITHQVAVDSSVIVSSPHMDDMLAYSHTLFWLPLNSSLLLLVNDDTNVAMCKYRSSGLGVVVLLTIITPIGASHMYKINFLDSALTKIATLKKNRLCLIFDLILPL